MHDYPPGRHVCGFHHRPGRQPVPPPRGAAALPAGRDAEQEGKAQGQTSEPEPHLPAGAPGGRQLLSAHREIRWAYAQLEQLVQTLRTSCFQTHFCWGFFFVSFQVCRLWESSEWEALRREWDKWVLQNVSHLTGFFFSWCKVIHFNPEIFPFSEILALNSLFMT